MPCHELKKRGHLVKRQVALPVIYDGVKIDAGYRMDLLVDGAVVIEIKSATELSPVHDAQVLTYLRMSGCQLGYLVNFNVSLIKQGIRRFARSSSFARHQAS